MNLGKENQHFSVNLPELGVIFGAEFCFYVENNCQDPFIEACWDWDYLFAEKLVDKINDAINATLHARFFGEQFGAAYRCSKVPKLLLLKVAKDYFAQSCQICKLSQSCQGITFLKLPRLFCSKLPMLGSQSCQGILCSKLPNLFIVSNLPRQCMFKVTEA